MSVSMTADFPEAGQVIKYHYLWRWQAIRGETEGRKKRPSCVVLVVVNQAGHHVLFIVPITSKAPPKERQALAVPETEVRRAKLDGDAPLWIIVDELNVDILEASYTLEDRVAQGQFSAAFTDRIIEAVQAVRASGKLGLSKRT
jgi:hypothetical protein